ncbi:MAG: hypothetical protein A3F70_10495 [Acidobacteria bacterium RIFCSPLOWO2_12_FULL_67_14]|nr:MAG: hypothetical protein A3H29_04335 [Acidobacteria bacterium RIFCSPLOWO2_02_FULL_67_21]OFW38153.1 MAG: hypothetical protein A3F70_10495 [Acidobacteria bacterium RIFCSPLOWO2_12_FULL_67_14]
MSGLGSPAQAARRALLGLMLLCAPARADADWLFVPFLGGSFAPETTFLVFEEGAGRKLVIGGAVMLLGDGLLGLEADVGHIPGFFEGDDPRGLVLTSRVTTIGGNVVLAVPRSLTRESLRPYVVGGVGLLQARSKHAAGLFPIDWNLLGVTIGGGAIGFITDATGLRFDLRHIKAASGADGPLARPGISRLSFWRATVGLVIRY